LDEAEWTVDDQDADEQTVDDQDGQVPFGACSAATAHDQAAADGAKCAGSIWRFRIAIGEAMADDTEKARRQEEKAAFEERYPNTALSDAFQIGSDYFTNPPKRLPPLIGQYPPKYPPKPPAKHMPPKAPRQGPPGEPERRVHPGSEGKAYSLAEYIEFAGKEAGEKCWREALTGKLEGKTRKKKRTPVAEPVTEPSAEELSSEEPEPQEPEPQRHIKHIIII